MGFPHDSKAAALRATAVVLICWLAATGARAQGRIIYGSRSMGMGGTGVASSIDATTIAYNPANLGFMTRTDFQFPLLSVDATLQGDLLSGVTGIVDSLDDLEDQFGTDDITAIVDLMENASTPMLRQQARQATLELFLYGVAALDATGQGFTVRGITGPAYRYKNWAIGITGLVDVALDTSVDLQNGLSLSDLGFDAVVPLGEVNTAACTGGSFCDTFAQSLAAGTAGAVDMLDLEQARQLVLDSDPARLQGDPKAQAMLQAIIDQTAAGSPLSLENNESGAITTGIALAQLAVGYGHTVGTDKLSVGGTLRVYLAETTSTTFFVNELMDPEDILDEVTSSDQTKRSNEFGVDIGLTYRPIESLKIAFVGQNINSPSFSFSENRPAFTLDSQYSVGAAWNPRRWVTLTGEYDLTETNSVLIPELGYRFGRLGAEFVVAKFFAIRVGTFKNLGLDDSSLNYTGGLGFRIGRFEIAFSGVLSTDEFEVESGETIDTFPAGAGASLSLGWNSRF